MDARDRVLHLVPMREYDFTSLATGGAAVDIPLAQDVDLTHWGSGVLQVTVKSVTAPAGSQARLTLDALARSRDDPGARFRGPTLACATISDVVTGPALLEGALSANAGARGCLFLTAWQRTAGTFRFTMGVDLVVRAGVVAPPGSIDLTRGGSFARASEASYLTRAPSDGSTAFLAWAASGVRRASENRGDGLGAGLLVEKGATNYVLRSRALDDAAWTAGSATITADQNGGPDGAGLADRVQDASGSFGPYQLAPGPSGVVNASQWVRAVSGTSVSQINLFENSGSASIRASFVAATATYRRNATVAASASVSSGMMPADGRDLSGTSGGTTAHAEDHYIDLVQLEPGYYPTSAIRTTSASVTRPADTLSYSSGDYPAAFLTDGVVLVFAPDASSAEIVSADEDWRLVQVGASDYLRIRKNTSCVVELVCGGSVIASRTVTFSRGQPLTITARPSAGSLTVSGATTGDGTSTGTGAAWASSATLYVGGDSGGAHNATGRFLVPPGFGLLTPGISAAPE